MFEIFYINKFPMFPIRNIPKDVFKTLLLGAETIRKCRRVVSEIFPKTSFFLTWNRWQKKLFEIFYIKKNPIFPIRNIPKDVFKTLLWGAETIRKTCLVVSEIFPKRLFFLTSKMASVSHPPSTTIHHHPRYQWAVCKT